jgi:outer membrane immunogenic protein
MLQNRHGMALALGLSCAGWWGKIFRQGVVMRRLLCVSATLFALGVGTATAAELPIGVPGVPVYHAPVLLPFTWAGPYFGVNIGGQITNDSISTMSNLPSNSFTVPAGVLGISGPLGGIQSAGFFNPGEGQSLDAASPGTLRSSGAIGGMQAGYNWQFDNAVVGLEVDFEGATATGNRAVIGLANAPPGTALTQTVKQPMFITTVRPRVGWAFDHLLVYATGGYAFATYQVVDSYNVVPGFPGVQSDMTAKLSGWVAGAGVEYAFYKGMSLKLEYLYLGLGTFTSTIQMPVIYQAFNTDFLINPGSSIAVRHSLSDNIIRVGLNFHFGDGWY